MKRNNLVLAAALLLATSSLGLAQGTYTQFDVPGALETWVGTINNAGDIDGYYIGSDFNYHAFLYSNGTFTGFDYPGAGETFPGMINDKGQIAGQAVSGGEPPTYYGFIYDVATQTFTTISEPNGTVTGLCCINNAGLIAGTVSTTNLFGFVAQNSNYRVLNPPGTTTNQALVLTNAGVVVWGMTSSGSSVYYLYSGGNYTQLITPSKPDIGLGGVNPQGTIYVGSYSPNVNTGLGFVYHTKTGRFITLSYPNAAITNAFSINQSGEVVGVYSDSSNVTHGFTWTP